MVKTADELRRGREAYASGPGSTRTRRCRRQIGSLRWRQPTSISSRRRRRWSGAWTSTWRCWSAPTSCTLRTRRQSRRCAECGLARDDLAIRGEMGPAGGWFGRPQRLVEREARSASSGATAGAGRVPARGCRRLRRGVRGRRRRGRDRRALRRGGSRRARAAHPGIPIGQGRVEEGLGLLDEAMVAVTAGEVSPIVTGIVYCGVIAGCEEAFELRRAHEWTNALARWCEGQPQMVSFTGRCLAHRAGIMQLHGAWRDALDEAQLARERCEQAMNRAATGQALYQQAELHRLRGDFDGGEAPTETRSVRPGAAARARPAAARPGRRRSRGRRDDRRASARRGAVAARGAASCPRRDRARRRRHRERHAGLPTSSPRSRPAASARCCGRSPHRRCGAVELADGDARPRSRRCAAPRVVAGARRALRGGAIARAASDSPVVPRRRGRRRAGARGGPWRLRAAGRRAGRRAPRNARGRRAERRAWAELRASWRCCGSSPPARPTARSPPSSS